MEEIPDDVFAPSVSEMDGVQPGSRLQQHLGMGCGGVNTTLDGKKNTVRGQFNVKFILQSTFYNIWRYTYNIYIHICTYIYIYIYI